MKCNDVRNAVSARLDGEDPGIDPRALDAHLRQCPSCRGFAAEATALHREIRVAAAPRVPDLTAPILAAISEQPPRRAAREISLRLTLVAVAVAQLVAALPALILGNDAGLPVHVARHLGSFDLALAVGFLFAAWKPTRIAGLLPVVAALVACLIGTSVPDLLDGHTAAFAETHHVIDVVGLLAAWLLAYPPHLRRTARWATP